MNIPWSSTLLPANTKLARLGHNVATGSPALIGMDSRILLTGRKGTGKTWALRTLMANALERDHTVTLIADSAEAVWPSRVRTASSGHEVISAISDAWREMEIRAKNMRERNLQRWDGPLHVLAVDDGVAALAAVGGNRELMQQLVTVARLGWSRGFALWWATRNPRVGGHGAGLASLLEPAFDYRITFGEIPGKDVRVRPGVAYEENSPGQPVLVDMVDDAAALDCAIKA